jgi:hypothetical protein
MKKRKRKIGQIGDTKDKNESGTKKKEEKKWHTKEIERKVGMIQRGRRKIRCHAGEKKDGIEDRDKKEDRTKEKEEKKLT